MISSGCHLGILITLTSSDPVKVYVIPLFFSSPSTVRVTFFHFNIIQFAVLFPNPNNSDLVGLKVNASWNLSKEDFLHFIATGHAKMGRAHERLNPDSSPSLTRQEPYVQAILEMLGGWNIPEVIAVRHFQQFRQVQQTQQVPQNIHVPQQKPKTLREEIVERLETEKSNLRSIQSPEAVFKMGIINQMIKMIYSGKSKYAVTDWLNKKSRSSGADVRPLVREAYLIISDFDF